MASGREGSGFCFEIHASIGLNFGRGYPFQQFFTAVAEHCGLKGKMAATGYELPDIAMVDDDSDDDSDDEGEEA
jgi:hypothetical protein